jgi:hypothetical protein
VAFVNKQGGEERRNELAGAGEMIDFDPNDPRVVKVHYDLAAWTFDQRAELSEALAESETPHAWDGDELVVPELVEEAVDAVFERLESQFGPFPVLLESNESSTEFGLDEWTDADRALLTESLVEAEVPHRWEGMTLVVAADAEDSVDELLDAIEAGEVLNAGDDASNEPPDGVLGTIFLAASTLTKDPFDARARTELIDLAQHLNPQHPPYAFAQRTWAETVEGVDTIVEQIMIEAGGALHDEDSDEASGVVRFADELRTLLRPFV